MRYKTDVTTTLVRIPITCKIKKRCQRSSFNLV